MEGSRAEYVGVGQGQVVRGPDLARGLPRQVLLLTVPASWRRDPVDLAPPGAATPGGEHEGLPGVLQVRPAGPELVGRVQVVAHAEPRPQVVGKHPQAFGAVFFEASVVAAVVYVPVAAGPPALGP